MHLTTVVRHYHECLTTVCASHDSCATFARVSRVVRANFNQFYFLAIKSRMVLFMSKFIVRICIPYLLQVQTAEIKLHVSANICEGLATGWWRVRDTCDDLAIVLR